MQRRLYQLALLLALGSTQAAQAQVQAPLPASVSAPARQPTLPAARPHAPAYKPATAHRPIYKPATGYKPAGAGAGVAPLLAAPAEPAAAIWAATADYVFKSDSTLKWLAPELSRTLRRTTIKAFEQSLNQAVAVEARRLHRPAGKTSAFYFQTTFYNLLKNSPQSPPALAAAIQAQLLKNKPKRQQEPAFQEFEARLRRLLAAPTGASLAALAAAPAATTAAAAPATAPARPATTAARDTLAAPAAEAASPAADAPAPWWTWAALGLAALSTLAVAVLWSKLGGLEHDVERLRERLLTNPSPNRRTESGPPADMLPAIQEEVSRQLRQQLASATPVAAAARVVATPAVTASAATPAPATAAAPELGRRVQYVNEAPSNKSFRARALSDQPGSNSIFAIDSSEQPDQGTFTVTGNLASHVRDHRSALESVCEYQNGYPTGRETRIITKVPGQVRRRGSDWEVTQPAVIRFE